MLSFFKQGHTVNQVFPKEIYEEAFEALAQKGEACITLDDLFPYMLFFFLAKLSKGIDLRKKHFAELLGESDCALKGVLPFLIEEGLDPDDLHEKCITFAMVEKVVLAFKAAYPQSFGHE